MAHATETGNTRNITPQTTGFSQVHTRGGGEGGGQAMSVLLSWHEKVRPTILSHAHGASSGPRRPATIKHLSIGTRHANLLAAR